MGNLLDKIPYTILVPLAVWMLLAPFRPMPHALEKFNMLLAGTLTKPIDIFDLLLHATPWLLLILKVVRMFMRRGV